MGIIHGIGALSIGIALIVVGAAGGASPIPFFAYLADARRALICSAFGWLVCIVAGTAGVVVLSRS